MKIKSRTGWVRPPLTWGARGVCSVNYRHQQLHKVEAVTPGTNPCRGTHCNLPFCVNPDGFVFCLFETDTMWYLKNTAISAHRQVQRDAQSCERAGTWIPKLLLVPLQGKQRWCSHRTCLGSWRGHQSPREPWALVRSSEDAERFAFLSGVWVGGDADR